MSKFGIGDGVGVKSNVHLVSKFGVIDGVGVKNDIWCQNLVSVRVLVSKMTFGVKIWHR